MVTCKHCSSPNTLDSKYCRRCGTEIPLNELQEAQIKLDALVAEGINAFNQGRTDEALAIAESALAANPSMVNALSLASDCHARRHEYARALEYADQIVDQNPDSELDRIKRNQLRTQLEKSLEVPPGPDKRLALVAALAAVVLFGSIGAFVVKMQQDSAARLAEQQATNAQLVASNGATGMGGPNVGATESDAGATNPQPQAAPENVQTPPVTNVPQGQNDRGAGMEPPVVRPNPIGGTGLPPFRGSSLPMAQENGNTQIQPLDPGGMGRNDPTSNPPQPPPTRPGGDPDPVTNSSGSQGGGSVTPPEPDPGQIDIKIRSGSSNARPNPAGGGGVSVPDANGATALLRTAREQQQAGNLTGAAGSYEKALAAGGDPITINQRLGNIYSQLGRNAEAVASYERAMNAARAAANAGNNAERNRAIADSCQAAIRVLRGG